MGKSWENDGKMMKHVNFDGKWMEDVNFHGENDGN